MYNFSEVEKKWQKYWEDNHTFKTDIRDFSKPKYYALDMFPYPSGEGLHVGHPEGYTATDIVSRMKRMQGYNVLHPMGWDAFGLPAEQYAIKTGNHPSFFTARNIETFKRQLKSLGFSYDWDREISTADPSFYRWTQWIFKQLYNDGLAYQEQMPVNWCEELGTVLSNDEVIDGKSERGGFPVVRKNMKQWVMKITEYADRLLEGLDEIDWPSSTKEMQKNWIGRSVGAEVTFKVAGSNATFVVFTTRADTLFGATYCVLAPEHELVNTITIESKKKEIAEYQELCKKKSDLERTELSREKTGVFTGAYAVNPVNQKEIPIYISDYVLASYGTGAIMAVPAHDERDYDFAKKFNIPIIPVLAPVYNFDNPPQEGKKNTKRNTVIVVVKDPTEENYLTVKYKDFSWQSFVMGGIEEAEDAMDAARREVEEETGYFDFKDVTLLDYVFVEKFYAAHKDVNRETTNKVLVVTLNSLQKHDVIEEEIAYHEPIWIKKEAIKDALTIESHKMLVDKLEKTSGAFIGDGVHINSSFLDGLNKEEAISKMISFLEETNSGKKCINYHLRDWIFARQRYWGEPIPIVHYDDHDEVLEDKELPLVLPSLEDYSPSKTGESPLEKATDWLQVTKGNAVGKRETSTMPGSAGSSWYFLRYIDPHNDTCLADPELLKYWLPVDLYLGGPEHAVGHLLYSRFWNNYLYDKGIVPVKEPFKKLVHQGMILGNNGEKMSKSRGNVINPDEMVENYGADALRIYEMFMGPLSAAKPWDPNGIEGSKKFIERVYRIFHTISITDEKTENLSKIYHQTVKKVTEDYETLSFNTAISQMMIFVNQLFKEEKVTRDYAEGFIKLLNPIAPHLTEELWQEVLGHHQTISYEPWPQYDEQCLVENEVTMAVQINGKVRATILVNVTEEEESIKQKAISEANVQKHIKDKSIVKIIIIKGKIVNIVAK